MSSTEKFIARLELLKEGERSRLRRLAGQPLDQSLLGFDLFTVLWWPLRQESTAAPRRETSWLVAKLHATFAMPQGRHESSGLPLTLAWLLGLCEPRDEHGQGRFRGRFDALLCSTLGELEAHLRWGLSVAVQKEQLRRAQLNWAQLLDDLSLWDRSYNPDNTQQTGRLNCHERLAKCGDVHHNPQDLWACEYLCAINHQLEGAKHAD